MNKDFKLILEKASEVGAPMPLTAAALQVNAARNAVNRRRRFLEA